MWKAPASSTVEGHGTRRLHTARPPPGELDRPGRPALSARVGRTLALVVLALAALVVASIGWFLGGLALVLGTLAALARRRGTSFAVLLSAGLLAGVAVVVATGARAGACFGECVEVAGWGVDPFIVVLAFANVAGWSLGVLLGRLLHPIVRHRNSRRDDAIT